MWISPTTQSNQEYPWKDMIFNTIEDAMVEIHVSSWAQNGGFTVCLGRSRPERESSTNGFLALVRCSDDWPRKNSSTSTSCALRVNRMRQGLKLHSQQER